MQWMRTPSRHIGRLTLSVCGLFGLFGLFGLLRDYQNRTGLAYAAELKVPEEIPVERFDFEQQGIEGWKPVDGRWGVEEMSGAPSGKRVLVQRAAENPFNVIVAPSAPYTDVDVSVRCKPMAGREDASGGIVFRFAEGHY